MSAGGFLRVLRAAVFAAVCVVLAALGHVLMSGEGLPWWVLLSGAVVVGAVGWAFGAHERRRRTVAGLTVAVQTCLHIAFTLAQSGNRPAMAAAPGTRSPFGNGPTAFSAVRPPRPSGLPGPMTSPWRRGCTPRITWPLTASTAWHRRATT